MKVLLVYPYKVSDEIPLGLLYLSAMLKPEGHQVRLFYGNLCNQKQPEYYPSSEELKCTFIEMMDGFEPDLVGFSLMSTAFDKCLELSRFAKERGALTIWGGAHATVDPEFTIQQEPVDMVCVGEGEHAIMELLNGLEHDGNVTRIKNIWIKQNGKVYRNPIRPLINDLEQLPWPDTTLLNPALLNPQVRGANFITGRGCPYKCSYCINHQLQTLYKGKGSFVRYRKFESVVKEIKAVLKWSDAQEIVFSDEIIGLSKQRLIGFCKVYGEEVGLPFTCQIRPNIVDEEVAVSMKKAGCQLVSIGLESGNDRIRTEILNRQMDRETIISAFRILRDTGIKTGVFNMLGMPTETEDTIRDTIELNRKVSPDLMHVTILMPFKGMEIRETMQREGLIKKEASESYYSDVMQELPDISARRLKAYRYLFDLYVYTDRRYFFLINCLKYLWLLFPVDDNIKLPQRLIRSLTWRLTVLAKRLLISKGKAGT